MGYTVLPDGSIQTDDADEAIRLSKKLRTPEKHETNGAMGVAPKSKTQTSATSQGEGGGADAEIVALRAFVDDLKDNQRRALDALHTHGKLSAEDLCKELGLTGNMALGGVTSALQKNANKAKVDFSLLAVKTIEPLGGKKQIWYRPGLRLKEVYAK